MGRIARPPADDQEASVYWEDKWDARGKRFKADEVSCAHRTEAFGTIFVVTNLDNGKKIECPVQDRGPFARGRVLDFSLGAARKIGCDGLCRVNVRRCRLRISRCPPAVPHCLLLHPPPSTTCRFAWFRRGHVASICASVCRQSRGLRWGIV